MHVDWLFAALLPRFVSPHENFAEEQTSAAGLAALVVEGRFRDYRRFADKVAGSSDTDTDFALSAALLESVLEATQSEAISKLDSFRRSGNLSPGASVVAVLFQVMALCEQDQNELAISVLLASLAESANWEAPPSTAALFSATLQQQLAFRLAELGRGELAVSAARSAMNALPPNRAEYEEFETSRGIRSSARAAQLDLTRTIRASSKALIACGQPPGGKAWIGLVRSPETRAGAYRKTRRADSGTALVDSVFEQEIAWPARRRRMAFRDPVDAPLWAAQLNAEVNGEYLAVKGLRVQLGKTRVLRGSGASSWRAMEGLRLFRQASASEPLRDFIRSLRADGPVDVLADAGRDVLNRTTAGLNPSLCDMEILAGAAEFLSQPELESAIVAFELFREEPRPTFGQWTSASSNQAKAWQFLSRILPGSGCDAHVSDTLLTAIEGYAAGVLETMEAPVVSVIRAIDWSNVGPRKIERWTRWANQQSGGPSGAVALAAIDMTIGLGTRVPSLRPTGLGLAERLLREQDADVVVSVEELRAVEETCVQSLENIRKSSRAGSFSFGGYSAADVTCALIERFDLQSLWTPLVDFVRDGNVGTHEKVDALDRLSSGSVRIPETSRAALLAAPDQTLIGRDSDRFFDSDEEHPSTFPQVFRLRGRLGGLSLSERITGITQMAGASSPSQRVEAARSIDPVLVANSDFSVAFTVLLQLSFDEDPVVRSEAARELARGLGAAGDFTDPTTARLFELLASDGILIPLLTLRGLKDLQVIPKALLDRVAELSSSHPARTVRAESEEIIALYS